MIYVAEIKKNGLWISSGLSSTNLQDLNQKILGLLQKQGPLEIRIRQVEDRVGPPRKRCCGR